jgi:protein phosphatase
MPAEKLVEDRYHVIAPQIWLDTKAQELPFAPFPLPSQAMPYAHLYAYRLHIPRVYGFCSLRLQGQSLEVMLLDNIPVDRDGNLYPSLHQAWSGASSLEQVYWLWQIIDLWPALAGTGALSSLLLMENIRVDGWRVRLCELITDSPDPQDKVTLAKLASLWLQALHQPQPEIAEGLQHLLRAMQAQKASLRDASHHLNDMLVQLAARMPLSRALAAGTDPGAANRHNEDSYYPTDMDLLQNPSGERVAIICDGVAGHEGGEVASQLAVKMLKLQSQSLLKDIAQSTEIIHPDRIFNQIAAMIRVANNTIASQNDSQGRESRQRMSTTLVMAIQTPQEIEIDRAKKANSHEIYIAHIGDSRAYWITRDRCQLLTVDDDIATREVKQGRSIYTHSSRRPDASCLTQALGTKTGEAIYPTIQRFLALEDGILVLCSDGLSDRDVVEKSWKQYADEILDRDVPLDRAVRSWLDLALQENSDDNISVAIMRCRVNQTYTISEDNSLVPISSAELRPLPRPKIDLPATKAARALFLIFTLVCLSGTAVLTTAVLRPEWIKSWQERVMPGSID